MARSRKALILYFSSTPVCGIGTWVEMLSNELEKKDWDVTVGLAWGRHFHDPGKIERFRPGLKTVWMDGRTGTGEGRIRAIETTVRTVKPDVVILTCIDAAFEAVRRLKYMGAAEIARDLAKICNLDLYQKACRTAADAAATEFNMETFHRRFAEFIGSD